MTVTDVTFTTTGRRGVNQATALLVEAAARGDVQVRQEFRWPVYLINGVVQPDVRPLMVRLLNEGVLRVADPDVSLSLIVPRGGAR